MRASRSAKILPLLLVAQLLALRPVACSADAWFLKPGEFQTDLTGSSFSTTSYFDDNGDRLTIASNGTYQRHAITSENVLGWKKWANLRFNVPFENLSVQQGTTADPANSRTQSGLSDLLVGLIFKIKDGPTAVSLEGNWQAPLGYNERLVPAVGTGTQSFGGSLHLGMALPSIQGFVEASGGYASPYKAKDSADEKALTVATASLGFWLGSSVLLAGNYDGVFESSQAVNPTTRNRAGPEVIYRVDDGLDVFAGSTHTFSSTNALHADEFYVGLAAKKSHLDRLQGFLGSKRRH